MSTNGRSWNSAATVAREAAGWVSYTGGLYGSFLLVKDSYRYGKKFLAEAEEAEREEAAKRAAKAIEQKMATAEQAAPQPQPVAEAAAPATETNPMLEAIQAMTAAIRQQAEGRAATAEELQQQVKDLQEQLRLQPVGGRWQATGRPRKSGRKATRKAARKPSARMLADGETRSGRRTTRSRRMQMQS